MVFTHSAFLYDTDDAYVSLLSGFVNEGLERGETVAVAAAPDRVSLLRDALDGESRSVSFLPADEWYVRPARTIAGWAQILRTAAADGSPFVRLVGQIPYAGPYAPWLRFEAALNRSLAELDGHLLCPYDRKGLPDSLLRAAVRTHPRLHDGDWCDNAGYEKPEEFLAATPEAPWPVSGEPVVVVPVEKSVAGLRALVRDRATAEAWLPADRVEILVLAVSEIGTNSIRHGGADRELRVWLTADAVVTEVTDDGTTGPSPLAGYLLPRQGEIGGMGLWLVQQLCDALSIRQHGGLTRVRFAVRRG
ncbi:sensor histidine kinase [Couchioplanes caeruleus]|uniref:Anti-sigma regulatory factor (Ser/Thr protein kinase) n=1 Tax=Couchioplanes caeruleus TaxID=56438 RepID=A0A3N1GPN0_9ACTN|nr:sensor histidine kinase [Couchioplanes caeruleus]ROP32181.1 anti-sigma regulatory factor (Ser/Thr protein kinase) [Couchioplanes caeruleus]